MAECGGECRAELCNENMHDRHLDEVVKYKIYLHAHAQNSIVCCCNIFIDHLTDCRSVCVMQLQFCTRDDHSADCMRDRKT
jgi:hypothetical protein